MQLNDILSMLEVREISSLYPHEQTIPRNLLKLQEAMFNLGQLVDPLVVDKDTGVVLDGNHRLVVLKNIEIPNAVVQPVDYSDPSIGLGTWLPISENHLSLSEFEKIGEKTEPVDYEAGARAVDSLEAIFMVVQEKEGEKECTLVSPGSYDVVSMTNKQNSIVSALQHIQFGYYADDMVDEHLKAGKTVLYRRSYRKEEVTREALAGRPFPPKSTRHTIPNRIIRLNMRLGWLLEEKESAFSLLKEMLSHRVYSGNVRRYPEPVIVIY